MRIEPRASAPHTSSDAVEQLVLRGDGLTTTSLETLTGREIGIQLQGQRRVRVLDGSIDGADLDGGVADGGYAGPVFDADGPLVGAEDLDVVAGDELLVRRVHLTDRSGIVYGVGEVVAVLNRLPDSVVETLLVGSAPLGKAFVAAGVAVRRELRRWGRFPAGELAETLGARHGTAEQLPRRTYRMVAMSSGAPLTVITEWFAPRVFDLDRPTMDRPRNPHRPVRR